MILSFRSRSRQPNRETWSLERLRLERAHALGASLERSTAKAYASAFLSYATFCEKHGFHIRPNPDTLSFYIVYMSHFIQPSSVKSYLSGICAELEAFWPDVREIRKSYLVSKTLARCMKLYSSPPHRKCALSQDDLAAIIKSTAATASHDDLLFAAIAFTGWHCLMHLGELVDADSIELRDYRKTITRRSVASANLPRPHVSFTLPMHKADRFWEGSTVILEQRVGSLNPLPIFNSYLNSRDDRFFLFPELWLKADGRVPTRSWFINRLKALFPDDNVAGHSLRSGGATALALAGVPLARIQIIGRWSSEAFLIYIRQNPILLQSSITGHSAFDAANTPSSSI